MKKFKTILLILLPLVYLIQCNKNPDRKIQEAIELYRQGNKESIKQIESEFINKISVHSIKADGYLANDTVLYSLSKNSIDILQPMQERFIIDGDEIKHFALNENYFVATDGETISIFEIDGNHINDTTVGDKKNSIKAVAIHEKQVFYYKDEKIYFYDIILDTTSLYINEKFSPPYSKYFQVILKRYDTMLGVLTGIAGKYYYSIIDLANEKILVKNISLSSSKFLCNGDNVYYIFGSTGNWQLIRFNVRNKDKTVIAKFTNLIDIELTSMGYVYENNDGLWVASYDGFNQSVPLPYQLSGKYRDFIMLNYRGMVSAVDVSRLIEGIQDLRKEMPEMFPEK